MKAIIFDMDGVLINSTKYVTQAFNTLLKEYNINVARRTVAKYRETLCILPSRKRRKPY